MPLKRPFLNGDDRFPLHACDFFLCQERVIRQAARLNVTGSGIIARL